MILLFTLSLDILAIWTVNGYFTRVNPAFSKTVGWSTEEILERPIFEFVHPDDRAVTIREIEKMASTGENVLQFENRYLHKDGSIRVLSWRSVFYEGGVVFSSARDVTGVREAEQAVVAAKDAFLATMSHEIRTPLNGLLGMLELLSLWQLDGEQGETLEIARESGRGLVRIIDDILDFAKITAGKLEIRPGPVSIAQLLRRVIDTFHAVASAKDLTLRQTVDSRISPSLLADSLRVSQILNNLVSNALKFTIAGYVEMRAELLGRKDGIDTVRLSVKDTVVGMEPEVQQRLFQPFEQASAFTAGLHGGTGLGLSISRRLAEMMGGSVEVKSALGEGTTMSLTLSLLVSDVAPAVLRDTKMPAVPPCLWPPRLVKARWCWRWTTTRPIAPYWHAKSLHWGFACRPPWMAWRRLPCGGAVESHSLSPTATCRSWTAMLCRGSSARSRRRKAGRGHPSSPGPPTRYPPRWGYVTLQTWTKFRPNRPGWAY
jgi:PAS domain S-box-containing protein